MAAERPGPEELLDQVTASADAAMREAGVPGVALGVVARGRTAATGLGVTSVASPRPVTSETVFRFCSVTKPCTSTLAYLLSERGLLDIDAPVGRYLPALELASPGLTGEITPRHLMLHVSGLEGELNNDLFCYGRDDDAVERMLADFPKLRQFARPGELWGYGNAGYWLLGAVIAEAAGSTFEDAMRTYLLSPLGMASTRFLTDEPIGHPLALPHRQAAEGAAHQEPVDSFAFPRAQAPSGGLTGSVVDLLRFARLHLGVARDRTPPVIGEPSRRELREPVVRSYDRWTRQATGWAVQTVHGHQWAEYDGSYRGYKSSLVLVPELGTAVAVLANSLDGSGVVTAVKDTTRHLLLGAKPSAPAFIDLPAEALARFEGEYRYPRASVVVLKSDDGGLRVRLTPVASLRGQVSMTAHERAFRPTGPGEFAEPVPGRPDLMFFAGPGSDDMRVRYALRLGLRR